MKALIVGDFHDRDLTGLEYLIKKEKPTQIISLGDFDIIPAINELINLSKKHRVISVAGNHEHAFLNDMEIYSPTIDGLRTTAGILHRELMENKAAMEYVKKLTLPKNLIKTLKIGKFDIAIVHGALNGYLRNSPDFEDANFNKLWYRLLDKDDMKKNFEAMQKKGFNLMIRGHDHEQCHMRYKPEDMFDFEKCEMIYAHGKQNEFMSQKELNVICAGAYCEGLYAVLKDEGDRLTVTYCSI